MGKEYTFKKGQIGPCKDNHITKSISEHRVSERVNKIVCLLLLNHIKLKNVIMPRLTVDNGPLLPKLYWVVGCGNSYDLPYIIQSCVASTTGFINFECNARVLHSTPLQG